MNAIAKHLATGLDVRTASLVASVSRKDAGWVVSMADGSVLEADAVIMTSPVPQTLTLLAAGGVELTALESDALHAVQYDPCLAVMVVLDGSSDLASPGAVDPDDGPIDWMADNQVKGISDVPALTIHATAEFSRDNWDVSDDEIADALLTAAGLSAAAVPGARSIQKWRYARPSVEHPERCLMLEGPAPMVCAGDAFGGAKVEGAALSGAAAADTLADAFGLDLRVDSR